MKHRARIQSTLLALTCALSLGHFLYQEPPPESPEKPSVLSWLESEGRFSRFLSLLSSTGLQKSLFESEAITLFVPTDEAFARYSDEVLAELATVEQRADLIEMLRFHAIDGRWDLAALGQRARIQSLQGQDLALRWSGGNEYSIDVARITQLDVACENGIVHVIDEPLLPTGLALAKLLNPTSTQPHTYTVDVDHSSVLFRVMHMEVGALWGWFRSFEGEIVVDEQNPSGSSISIAVDVASLDTANQSRDSYLQTADFFDAEKHPKLTFKSRTTERAGKDRLRVTGDLSLRGMVRPLTIEVRKLGEGRFGPDWYKIGYEAEFSFLRSDFGMTFGIPGVAGDEVRLVIALEAGRPFE